MNITCTKCKVEKPEEEFHINGGTKTGRATQCKVCVNKYKKSKYPAKEVHFGLANPPHDHKFCRKCNKVKPKTEFHKCSQNRDGVRNYCRECRAPIEKIISRKSRGPRKVDTTITSTQKLCNKCKAWKLHAEFPNSKTTRLGILSTCKKCINKKRNGIYKFKNLLRPFKTHKKCIRCRKCLPTSEYYRNGEYGLESYCIACTAKRSREYRVNNPELIRKGKKKWQNSKATYLPAGPKLFPEDAAITVNGLLRVKCKNCRQYFNPTNGQCSTRVTGGYTNNYGWGDFYCSDECKQACDVFNSTKIPKSLRPGKEKSRNKQKGIKKKILETQCKEDGYNYCEKCGDILDVDIHHTWPLGDFSIGVDNPDTMLLLCPGCHMELHSRC